MCNFEWCCVWVLSSESLRVSYPFNYTTYMVWIKGFEPLPPWSQAKCSTKLSYIQMLMVGMARLELARDSSQRSLSPLRLPIPPHPYARHARSVPDTPCTYWLRAKVLLVQPGTRAILLGHGWRNCTPYRLSLPMKIARTLRPLHSNKKLSNTLNGTRTLSTDCSLGFCLPFIQPPARAAVI